MRFIKALLQSAVMLGALSATALAAPLASLQDSIKVDIRSTETRTVWYADPVWLAIGGLALILVIVLVVVAARGKSTTVVR